MKVKVAGYNIEGSADEIASLVKRLGKKNTEQRNLDSHRRYEAERKPVIIRKIKRGRKCNGSIDAKFAKAMELYKKGNISLRKSMVKGGISHVCGDYYTRYKKFLMKNGVHVVTHIRPKYYNVR
jgi:hypothetical protein